VVEKRRPLLDFCSICRAYIQDLHFKCDKKGCRYFACLMCCIRNSLQERLAETVTKAHHLGPEALDISIRPNNSDKKTA
jgi:hypothetical protein